MEIVKLNILDGVGEVPVAVSSLVEAERLRRFMKDATGAFDFQSVWEERKACAENEMTETKEYSDGTAATGTPSLPDLSPRQQAKQEAFKHLDDIEAVMGGRNGPSIQLRTLIDSLAA